MNRELPVDPNLGRGHRFPELEQAPEFDHTAALARFDAVLREREDVVDSTRARSAMTEPGKRGLLEIHYALFHPKPGAGHLRQSSARAVFTGQDCPEPEFVERALDNFDQWLHADSFNEIHPIEQAALALTRLVDIRPFEFGNRTAAIVFANFFLIRAAYPPFSVLPAEAEAFWEALSDAIQMQTEPLARAIYSLILRELDRIHE